MADNAAPAALELTHVLYNPDSHASLALALVTLSPILLMASYAALAVMTRELLVINMWIGQLACEGFNWVLKRAIRQERPTDYVGQGYGFPSSHSQYMGYFATFLILHLYFRHRFTPSGYGVLDLTWRLLVYCGLIAWAGSVCYSRLYLTYHTTDQILWGVGVGIAFGAGTYIVAELMPTWYPNSSLGRFKSSILAHPVAAWLRIRDGWAVWHDGGREAEWQAWRVKWERQRLATATKSKARKFN